jgi:hypothetical protein
MPFLNLLKELRGLKKRETEASPLLCYKTTVNHTDAFENHP